MADIVQCRAAIGRLQGQVTRQANGIDALLIKKYEMPQSTRAKDAFDNACEELAAEIEQYANIGRALDPESSQQDIQQRTEYYQKKIEYLHEVKAKVNTLYQQCLDIANRAAAAHADRTETDSMLCAATSARGRQEAERDRLEEIEDEDLHDTRAKGRKSPVAPY